MGETMNILNMDYSTNIELKKITERFHISEKACFFEKDILNFFQNNIPNFHYMFKDEVLIRGKDFTSPTGFDKDYFINPKKYPSRHENQTRQEREMSQNYSRSYNNLGRILEKKDESLIFKATLMVRHYYDKEKGYFVPYEISEDLIKGLFDDYMSCDYEFYSLACDRIFEIGDGDDTGAVEYHYLKDKDGIDTNQIIFIDIWVRSFID